MAVLSIGAGVVVAALGRVVAAEVLDQILADETLLEDFFVSVAKDGSKKLAGPVQALVERAGLSKAAQRQIAKNPTVFDLAGLAWADALAQLGDDDLQGAFGQPARLVRKSLHKDWFVSALIDEAPDALRFDVGGWKPIEGLPDATMTGLLAHVIQQVEDELEDPLLPPGRALVAKLLDGVPQTVGKVFQRLPGVDAWVQRRLGEETLRAVKQVGATAAAGTATIQRVLALLDGSADAGGAAEAALDNAQRLVKLRAQDVLGRTAAKGEFGLLPLGTTYVEPAATLGQGEPQPVREQLRQSLAADPPGLVLLSAPFGSGKSLTVRSLAADLAEEWLAQPDTAPLPILIHTPDAFNSKSVSLPSVVQKHLVDQTECTAGAAEVLWKRFRLVLLLDSYDELVWSKEDAKGWVGRMQRTVGRSRGRVRVVVAGRPYAFEDRWCEEGDRRVRIQRFDAPRVDAWLDATRGVVHHDALTAKELFERLDPEIPGTPILLLMAAWVWEDGAELEKVGKTGLYDRFIGQISKGKWAEFQGAHPVVGEAHDNLDDQFHKGAYREALGLLAWLYHTHEAAVDEDEREGWGLPRHVLEERVRQRYRLPGEPDSKVEDRVGELTGSLVLSLFVRPGRSRHEIRFSHRSFREFLAAEHLVGLLVAEEPVGKVPAWQRALGVELGERVVEFAGALVRARGEDAVGERLVGLLRDRRQSYWVREGVIEQVVEGGGRTIWIPEGSRGWLGRARFQAAGLIGSIFGLPLGAVSALAVANGPGSVAWLNEPLTAVLEVGPLCVAFDLETRSARVVCYRNMLGVFVDCRSGAVQVKSLSRGDCWRYRNEPLRSITHARFEGSDVLDLGTDSVVVEGLSEPEKLELARVLMRLEGMGWELDLQQSTLTAWRLHERRWLLLGLVRDPESVGWLTVGEVVGRLFGRVLSDRFHLGLMEVATPTGTEFQEIPPGFRLRYLSMEPESHSGLSPEALGIGWHVSSLGRPRAPREVPFEDRLAGLEAVAAHMGLPPDTLPELTVVDEPAPDQPAD